MEYLISVLVPIYQVEDYLVECIESILSQTYQYFELILCDDGSSDKSAGICDEYAKVDQRIKVFHKKNEGNYFARKDLLNLVQGEYVLFVDSDDYIDKDAIKKAIEVAVQKKSDIVMFGHTLVDNEGKKISYSKTIFSDDIMMDKDLKNVFHLFTTRNDLNYLWDKLIDYRLFSTIIYDTSIEKRSFSGEDKLMLVDVFQNAQSYSYLAEPLYFYRQSTTGMGRNFKLINFYDSHFVTQRIFQFAEKIDKDDSWEKAILGYYIKGMLSKIMSSVHCKKYASIELKYAYDEIRQYDLYKKALDNNVKIGGNILYHFIFFLFRHRMDDVMILLLKIEQRIMQVARCFWGKRSVR